jgi:hypothetical protein
MEERAIKLARQKAHYKLHNAEHKVYEGYRDFTPPDRRYGRFLTICEAATTNAPKQHQITTALLN